MYKSLDDWFIVKHSNDIKNWDAVKSTYHKPGCRLFVATTKKAGKEVLAGCFGVKLPCKHDETATDVTLIPENTYKICVSCYDLTLFKTLLYKKFYLQISFLY